MLLKVNYFAADKGKSFSYRVFKKADDPFIRVCGVPYNFFSNGFFAQFSNTIFFYNSLLICKTDAKLMLFSKIKKVKEMLFKTVLDNLEWKLFF